MSARMDQVASQAAPKWIRQEFDWSQIEPTRGSYNWSTYDTFMQLTAQHGVHVLPTVMDTPSWDGPSWNAIPSDPTDYATFVAAVVKRYGPHGSFWSSHPTLDPTYALATYELWNEPYYSNGNNGNYNPATYANLVKAATTAGRAADPTTHYLLAAENQSQLVNSTWVWWVDALYQAVPDLNKYFDGVVVHPYGTDLTTLTYPTVGVAYNGYDQVRRVESIRQEFVNHGASDKPLWLTEIGWPTCTSGSTRCTTETGQANNLTTVFNYARTTWKPYVQAVFVYNYQDNGSNSTDPENDYGLVYYNGTPKPALTIFKQQTALS
jgi:polysaccharide biosynthesis protein PslG